MQTVEMIMCAQCKKALITEEEQIVKIMWRGHHQDISIPNAKFYENYDIDSRNTDKNIGDDW